MLQSVVGFILKNPTNSGEIAAPNLPVKILGERSVQIERERPVNPN